MADGRLSVKGPGGADVDRQFRQSRPRVSRQTPHRHGPGLPPRLGRMALNAARRLIVLDIAMLCQVPDRPHEKPVSRRPARDHS
jgi:hypothetical protein